MPAVPSNPANYCFPTWKYGIYPFPGEITRSAARQWKAACSCTVKAHCGKHSSLISLYIASVSHRCIPKWSLLIWFLGSHKIQLLFCYLQHGFWACESLWPCAHPPRARKIRVLTGSCLAAQPWLWACLWKFQGHISQPYLLLGLGTEIPASASKYWLCAKFLDT